VRGPRPRRSVAPHTPGLSGLVVLPLSAGVLRHDSEATPHGSQSRLRHNDIGRERTAMGEALAGRVAVVTGGASGIGRAAAVRFAVAEFGRVDVGVASAESSFMTGQILHLAGGRFTD
jgi:hypothetical protein